VIVRFVDISKIVDHLCLNKQRRAFKNGRSINTSNIGHKTQSKDKTTQHRILKEEQYGPMETGGDLICQRSVNFLFIALSKSS